VATTLISGDLATDTIASGQKVVDMDDRISELEPNNAPFVHLLRKLNKKGAINPEVRWLEQVSMPRFDTFSASATSAATALGVTNAAYFRVGDGVRITETGEFIQITGVSASSIGANRGIGGTTAASATSAAGLYIVNNANAEGASLRTIKTVKLTQQNNYCQIIRTPFGVTGTEMATKMYGQYANDRVRLQRVQGLEHERAIEATLFWGAKKEDVTTSGAPVRFAGGMFEYISTNVTNVAGTLTRASFETFLRSGFRYGSEEKWLFVSPLVNAALDGFAWNSAASSNGSSWQQYTTDVPAGSIGVQIKKYYSSQGTVNIVLKRHWNDNADLRGAAFLVDLPNVTLRTLRDTKLLMDRQAPDADKVEDEYLSELTLEVQQESKHAYMKGVTG